jgi:ABC-type branched-subunit amino acid transport system permease subunit
MPEGDTLFRTARVLGAALEGGRILSAELDGRRARWWFALLVTLLLAVNGLNVVNSYVGRDFISAINSSTVVRVTGSSPVVGSS